MPSSRPAAAAVSLLLAAACGASQPGAATARRDAAAPPAPPAAARVEVDELTVQHGCDETFVARDPAATTVVTVEVPGLLARSREATLPYRETLEVSAGRLDVRLEQGLDLEHWCTDVMSRPPRIASAWTAVSGTATVLVHRRDDTAAGGSPAVAATVRLSRTVLADAAGEERRIELPPLTVSAQLGRPGGG
ncbi:MAG TPA: hypothetical protein VHM02_03960 [Thermoanaerobaculia bacterium]|nr:hypothetical protein [Thermoanaerobaculia bacterium]